MSNKASKKLRKHFRQELKARRRVMARLRAPLRWLPRTKKGWQEVNRFPRHQLLFAFRFENEVETPDGIQEL